MQLGFEFTRRATLLGVLALGACAGSGPAASRPANSPGGNDSRFAAIERRIGGRVGVAAWNTGTDQWIGHRRNERFAMCSTFKWALAAAQLNMAQNGGPQLNEQVRFDESDMLDYAPVAREYLARGWMTIEQACAASVVMSDNTAANLLLEIQGGPGSLTRFLRQSGDSITQLDRNEPSLNENLQSDPRDTTMPHAMVRTLKRVLLEDSTLTSDNRERVIGWMIESPTGRERLRSGLPSDWRVGDKTGTSNAGAPGSAFANGRNATNDVAIAWPPGRAPIIIASYFSDSAADPDARNAAHAEVGRIVAETWS